LCYQFQTVDSKYQKYHLHDDPQKSYYSNMAPGINSLLKGCLIKLIMCAPHIGVLAVLVVFQIPQIAEHDSACCTNVAPGSYPLSTQLYHRLSCCQIIS